MLIGIGGRLGSGKDAISDYLVEKHGWTKMGMSDPLHEAMLTLNPIVEVDYWDDYYLRYADLTEKVGYVEAKKNEEYRRLLQVFGTEVIRGLFNDNVWVDNARNRITEVISNGGNVIITGMRFPNELALINHLGGLSWWVDRPGYGDGGGHISEEAVSRDDFDLTIVNDGTLNDLYSEVETGLVTSFVGTTN